MSIELQDSGRQNYADPRLVERQLQKILASAEFARSDRLARFLRYVVRCQLEQRAGGIKERVIGMDVFDKPADWDPKADNIVRTEARRLRAKLDQYYSEQAHENLVRISIPKGGYVPEFDVLAPAPEMPVPAPPPQPPPGKPARTGLLAAALGAAALVWTVNRLWYPSAPAAAALPQTLPFANEIGLEINPAISPDGRSVAYVWDGNGENYDIYIKPLDQGPATRPRRFTDAAEAEVNPAWSPDGRQIAFLRIRNDSAAVVLKDLDTGQERALTRVKLRTGGWIGYHSPNNDEGPSWLPDGESLIVSDAPAGQLYHAMYRVSIHDASRQLVVRTEREVADYFPRVSPDGRQLAFARYTSHGVSDIFVCAIDGSNPRQLTSDHRGVTGLAWDADGRSLYYTAIRQGSPRIWKVRATPGAEPEPLPDSVVAGDISVSPRGGWMAYAALSENWNVWRMPLAVSARGSSLGEPQRFLASSGRNHGPSFSPDGKTLAFISDRGGAWAIWLCDPNGERPRQLTHFDGGFLGAITWTPDSRKIAFDARPSGNSNIYTLDIGGNGAPVPLDSNRFEERTPAWSADGRYIYFNSNREGNPTVWRRSMLDGSLRKAGLDSSFKSLQPFPGDTLYFNVKSSIYRAGLDGSNPQPLPDVVSSPDINWTVSKGAVYYTQQKQSGEVEFYEFIDGHVRLLRTAAGRLVPGTTNLTISADHKWLLYAQLDHFTSDIVLRKFPAR